MSLDATRWAWQQDLRPTQKLVLLSLSDRADERHCCYPSFDRLSSDTGLDVKTVRKVIRELRSLGLLVASEKPGRGYRYRLAGVSDRHKTPTESGTPTKTGTGTKSGRTTPTKSGTPPLPKVVPESTNNLPTESLTPYNPPFAEKVDWFARFWTAYPKKVGKKACLSTWTKRKLDAMGEQIVEDVKRKTQLDSGWQEGFAPNPLTYLNGDRWEDEIQTGKKDRRHMTAAEHRAEAEERRRLEAQLQGRTIEGELVP